MPSTIHKSVRGPIRRPEYQVLLDLPGGRRRYLIDAPNLNYLADVIEREVRVVYPQEHVGIRLDADGTVYVRLGMNASQPGGRWSLPVAVHVGRS